MLDATNHVSQNRENQLLLLGFLSSFLLCRHFFLHRNGIRPEYISLKSSSLGRWLCQSTIKEGRTAHLQGRRPHDSSYVVRNRGRHQGEEEAYKELHTLYEAEQKRADRMSGDEAARELKNEENSGRITKQLKKALDP